MNSKRLHEVTIGGAVASVQVIQGHLLLEHMQRLHVADNTGVLMVWSSQGQHALAAFPPDVTGDLALVSDNDRIVEVHGAHEQPYNPVAAFRYAFVMEEGWFDRNCTTSRCVLNLD